METATSIDSALRTVPKDKVFPDLAEYLLRKGAPDFVAKALSELTGGKLDTTAGHLCFFRYRPGKRCLFLWVFSTSDKRTALLSGTMFGDQQGAEIVSRLD